MEQKNAVKHEKGRTNTYKHERKQANMDTNERDQTGRKGAEWKHTNMEQHEQ
jgi:hypothetical protein